MADYVQTWRRQLKLKVLVKIAREELKAGKDINQVCHKLDTVMKVRWNFVSTTRRQYLYDINRILSNQYVLGA